MRSGDAIYVRVGDHDLTRKYGSPGAQTLRVATTYIHHNHNSQTLDNDIALLKLHGQAELKDGVCLVCLPARGVSHAAGKRCTVTGYGYMGEAGPIPLRIREAEIPVVSDTECIRKINAVTEKIFILPASSFCAGGEAGNDACQVSTQLSVRPIVHVMIPNRTVNSTLQCVTLKKEIQIPKNRPKVSITY